MKDPKETGQIAQETPKAAPGRRGKLVQRGLVCLGSLLLLGGLLRFFYTGDSGYTVTTYSMGSYVQQTVYGGDREEAAQNAASAVAQLEDLISWREENSDVFRLNQQAGKDFIALDPRTAEVFSSALQVCRASGGAFDFTIAPVSRLWSFDDDPHLPKQEMIEEFREKVDYTKFTLKEDGTAALRYSGTALELGAVGKGAACDAAVQCYAEAGVKRAVVAVGGSIGVYGKKPFGEAWRIAVRNPAGEGSLGILSIESGFVSTSGSYEKCFEEDGKTYHHILDPATGYPAESGLLSVTVWSESGAVSDALSTACFVLGVEASLPVLEELGAEAVFVEEAGQVYVTAGLEKRFSLTAAGYRLEALP